MRNETPPWKTSSSSNYGDIIEIADFLEMTKSGMLSNYDGHGYQLKETPTGWLCIDWVIQPSDANHLYKDCTHIDWYNR